MLRTRAQSLIEYAVLIVAVIAIVALAATALGTAISAIIDGAISNVA